MDDTEARRQSLANKLKWGGGVLLALVAGPVLFLILKGILGLAALAVAGVAGFTIIQMWPVFAMKIANWRMKLIVAEAQANPIETMKSVFLEKIRII